jgi:hypothetical protein
MPRGLPDYGIPQYSVATQSIDMATLVLAQTGICSIDGKGRIFYADNFHAGLSGFELASGGDGKNPYPATTHCYIPPLSMGMYPGTINGNGLAYAYKLFTIPDTNKAGVEVMVGGTSSYPVIYDIMVLYGYKDMAGYQWEVKWNTNDGTISIYANGSFINIGTYYPVLTFWLWTQIKLVCNLFNGKYDRLLLGTMGYNLSTYNGVNVSVPNKGLFEMWLHCRPALTYQTGDYGRYGYVIVTVDEP